MTWTILCEIGMPGSIRWPFPVASHCLLHLLLRRQHHSCPESALFLVSRGPIPQQHRYGENSICSAYAGKDCTNFVYIIDERTNRLWKREAGVAVVNAVVEAWLEALKQPK